MLLRHPKEESFSLGVMKGKNLVYVVVVMFNTWKVSSCQLQERLFAGGK